MPNDELMRLRGRLATAQAMVSPLAAGIDLDIDQARAILDKYEAKTKLRTGELLVIGQRLHDQVQRYKEIAERIQSIKEDLGEA